MLQVTQKKETALVNDIIVDLEFAFINKHYHIYGT
tara:strand:- start:4972 stop:5076 length:105 start_codon:yes stop_codon:yes gene_type:complete